MKFKDLTIDQLVQHCIIQRKCSECRIFAVCNTLFNEAPEVWARYEPSILEGEVSINEVKTND